MSRYIDADALIEAMGEEPYVWTDSADEIADELYCPEMCEGCCEWDSHYEPKDEPQTERSE